MGVFAPLTHPGGTSKPISHHPSQALLRIPHSPKKHKNTPRYRKPQTNVSAPNAVGVYSFRVTALDSAGTSYGASSLVLVVLPCELLPEILGHLQAILAYYKVYGIQYVIWYLLIHFYRDKGITFTEVKALYEFLRRKRLGNGTVGDLLERMERKGIIVKRYGKYYAGAEDEKLVLEAIDVKRVRAGRRGARQPIKSLTESSSIEGSVRKEESMPLDE